MRSEIVFFTQDDRQAAPGRIAGDAGAIDAATHHQHVALKHILLRIHSLSHFMRSVVQPGTSCVYSRYAYCRSLHKLGHCGNGAQTTTAPAAPLSSSQTGSAK